MSPWRIEAEHLARAARAVRAHAIRTPLVAAPALGDGVWLKLETLQQTGSFKVRGALAALAARAADPGVVTASAGNHGYGLAHAGRVLGVPVTVCVSRHAPSVKRAGIAAAGAAIELVDARGYDDVEAHARALAAARGLPFVSPFDDPDVAAGNGGTIALEVLEDRPDVATIVAPIGGGGLIAGIAAARRIRAARFALVGVQSEACPAMAESLARGHALLRYEGTETLAEGLEGGVSESTFAIVRDEVDRVDQVSEAAIADAMRVAHEELGLSLEGSAATVIAWLRQHGTAARPVVLIVTGGNVDEATLARVLAR